MSVFRAFYEFQITEESIRHLVEDCNIILRREPVRTDVVRSLLDAVGHDANSYTKAEINDKPAILLKFSKRLEAECLPHAVEGAQVYVHPGTEGYIEIGEFQTFFEASLSRWRIPFKRYDGSRDRM
jgi:hypothetical protein